MGVLQDEMAGDVGSVPRCQTCGSERVARAAWTCWNSETGLWELERLVGLVRCYPCDAETTLVWQRPEEPASQRIRELNDRFRCGGVGNGSVMITVGLAGMGEDFVAATVQAVRCFDAFTKESDPWGEHDFGAIEIEGERVFFKIDYYNCARTAGSENPANEGLTHRVLTIMLAGEY